MLVAVTDGATDFQLAVLAQLPVGDDVGGLLGVALDARRGIGGRLG